MRTLFLAAFVCCVGWAQMAPAPGGGSSRAIPLPLSSTPEPGSVSIQESAGSQGVSTVNGTVAVSGDYQGSVLSHDAGSGPLRLSLGEAVRLALKHNLGTISSDNATRLARAQRLQYLSSLMPNIFVGASQTVTQVNLAAYGFQFKAPPGSTFSIPTVVGPYTYSSLSGNLSQQVWDPVARRNYQVGKELEQAARLSAEDSRELVTVAVAGTYFQIATQQARIESQLAQISSAHAIYEQAVARKSAGTNSKIDVMRSLVELQTQQQRLAALQADLAKQKIQLARIAGFRMDRELILADGIGDVAGSVPDVDVALQTAVKGRRDLRALQVQVTAAELALSAAHGERLPSVSLSGDYGVIGPDPTSTHGVFAVTGSVNIPIWNGGRTNADIEQAQAVLHQRQAEYADAESHVEQDIRNAAIEMSAAIGQWKLATTNREYARESLEEARDRFQAGVATTVEVVQAQEQLAGAENDYSSSLFAYRLAQLSLSRAQGMAEQQVSQLTKGGQQ